MLDRLDNDMFQQLLVDIPHQTLLLRCVNKSCRDVVDASDTHCTIVNTCISHHVERQRVNTKQYDRYLRLERGDMVTGHRYRFLIKRYKNAMNRHGHIAERLQFIQDGLKP